MKTNLDEFIKHENDDIVEQHAFIKNVEKIYSELTKLFDEFHFEVLHFFFESFFITSFRHWISYYFTFV